MGDYELYINMINPCLCLNTGNFPDSPGISRKLCRVFFTEMRTLGIGLIVNDLPCIAAAVQQVDHAVNDLAFDRTALRSILRPPAAGLRADQP